MTRATSAGLLVAAALLAVLAATSGILWGSQPAAALNGTLYVDPASQTVAQGAVFSADFRLNSDVAVTGAESDITFDPTILQIVSLSTPYAGAGVSFTYGSIATANSTGFLDNVDLAINPALGSIAAGDNLVWTVKFEAQICGSSDLALSDVDAQDTTPASIPTTSVDGSVDVGCAAFVAPPTQVVERGDVFDVDIKQNADFDTTGLRTDVDFDADVLQIDSITAAYSGGGVTFSHSSIATANTTGHLDNLLFDIGFGLGFLSPGEQLIFTITFEAQACGTSPVALSDNGMKDINKLSVPVLATDGDVVVACEVRVDPAVTSVLPGDTFDVTLIQNADFDTTGVQATIEFDKDILQVVSVVRGVPYSGSLFAMGVAPETQPQAITYANTNGRLRNVAAFYPGGSGIVSPGDQDFVTITFQAGDCGTSPIDLLNLEMLDAGGADVTAIAANGSVEVVCPLRFGPVAQIVDQLDIFTVDLIQDADFPTTGAQADITFDPAVLQIQSVALGSGYPGGAISMGIAPQSMAAAIAAANVSGTLQNLAGYFLGAGPTVPPGSAQVAVITFQGTNIGISALTMSDEEMLDASGLPVAVLGEPGQVQVQSADVEITTVALDCGDSAQTNQPFTCTADVTVHNNGPTTPAAVDVIAQLVAPFDCTAAPSSSQTATTVELDTSVSEVITIEWDVTCTAYSFHLFAVNSTITLDGGLTDTVPGNNQGNDQDTTAVSAFTDVEVTTLSTTAPGSAGTGASFNVTVDIVVHNNGPVSPLDGEGAIGIAVPADCTKTPAGAQLFNPISIPVSVNVPVSKAWTVSCSQPGTHHFISCGRAGPATLHVLDSLTSNGFKSQTFTIDIGAAGPDVFTGVGCSTPGDPAEVCDNGIDDDGDTLVDEQPDTDADGLSDCVDADDDGDGFSDVVEDFIGTYSLNDCPKNIYDSAWPVDFDNNQSVNISDVLSMKPAFNTSHGSGAYNQRHDLTANGSINISDVLALKPSFNTSCS